ncbi:fibrinogen-like protein A [Dysidea avara]|uniref:fibrinogen-like protein A n=1 Tax=Dysidea avara TaxID=196820 RepID=UPI003320CAEE
MIIIPQLVIIALSLLLVNADDEEYCTKLIGKCNEDFTTKCKHRQYNIKNCCNLKMFSSPTGVYTIRKEHFDTTDVYCDMDTDDGGWIVIQRNKKDSEQSFNKNWESYENGFGNLTGEFWYWLKGINCIMQTGQWEMRVGIQNSDNTWTYLHYNQFKVGTDSEG